MVRGLFLVAGGTWIKLRSKASNSDSIEDCWWEGRFVLILIFNLACSS